MAKTLAVVTEPKGKSPVDHQIALKERLIRRLNNEIVSERKECEERVKAIEFRIQMAQTLVDALKRGK